MPVPFDYIFPSDTPEGAVTFDVEFDLDPSDTGHSTPNNDENTEAFGEVFIDSPNPQSVSSLALVSDWVVTSCHPKSDQPQTVNMRRQFPIFHLYCHSITLVFTRFSLTVLNRSTTPAVHMSSLEVLNIPSCKCPRLVDLALTLVSRV